MRGILRIHVILGFILIITTSSCFSTEPKTSGNESKHLQTVKIDKHVGLELSGKWSGYESGWGWVTIKGNEGTYTDTYGGDPGKLEFEKVGQNSYRGTWGESEKRHGTMTFTVSEDGKMIVGTNIAAKDCEIRPGSKAKFLWLRQWSPRLYDVEFSFEMTPDPNTIDRARDLKVWIPIPREWDSQKAVKIISVQPEPHARYMDTEHGNPMLFWDFGRLPEQTTYRIDIRFSLESYDIDIDVDPERIGPYDRTNKEYRLYTRSTYFVNVTAKIQELAQVAVGSETNPYLQAQRIFDFVRKNVAYMMTFERGTEFLLRNIVHDDQGNEYYAGDCSQHSAMFVALCRAVGIPARSVEGFVGWNPWAKAQELKQFHPYDSMLSPDGYAGARHCVALSPHVWSEFYIQGVGWIPVDATNGLFGHLHNRRIIMSKGNDVKIGPYTNTQVFDGYGTQWVPLHDGRVDGLQSAVWNIAKIRDSKVTIVHRDPYKDLLDDGF